MQYSCTLVPPCAAATSPTHCCEMWLPRQCHLPIVTSQRVFTVSSLDHCLSSHFMNWAVTSALAKKQFVHCKFEQNHRLVIFQQWHNLFLEYFLCKLTFSFIQISTSNIKFEIRIHQLNEKVNSTSGFDIFSILCSDFKVNFLRYWGWTVNSAVSVYVKFNILQNGITDKNERSHFKPNFTTYKCMSIPPHIYKCCQNINAKCSILQQNMQCHINKS